MNWFEKFLTDSTVKGRMLRTLAEVVLSWLITNGAVIVGQLRMPSEVQTALVGLLTAVFTAILGFVNDKGVQG